MFSRRDSYKNNQSYKHNNRHDAHVHTHGAIDPSIFTTQRGIWAIKWSFFGLLATALFQVVIVLLSGSVRFLPTRFTTSAMPPLLFHYGLLLRLHEKKPANGLPMATVGWKT